MTLSTSPILIFAGYYAFTAIVTAYSKLIEVGEIEARIQALEAAAERNDHP